jgi:Xaa-Pro aminopeptidase
MIRTLAPLLLFLLLQDSKKLPVIDGKELTARRAKLMEKFADGVVVVDAGVTRKGEAGIDFNTPWFDFFYLTGTQPDDGVLVLVPADKKAFLFADGDEKELKERSGASSVMPRKKFDEFCKDVLAASPTVYTKARQIVKDAVIAVVGKDKVKGTVDRELTAMRVLKSKAEIAMMKHAADATNKAHVAAFKAMKPGINEKEIQKLVEDTFKAEGCEELSFPSIIGSGKNGTILHYMENTSDIEKDTLVVCDIGAGYKGYATDITRTIPSSGKFTDEQKAAYQCVLDAQKAAEAVTKPGATFGDLEKAARAVFAERKLNDWSYCGSREMSVRHGLGHYVGLAVHDSGTYREKFAPGMVITIEPGYYNKEKGWGIRIEDIYVITETGFERLSKSPREVKEIEALMAEPLKK